AFRVLAKDDEVDVLLAAIFERRESVINQPDRTEVDVEIEREPCAEQDIARRPVIGYPRVSERPEQDRGELVGQHLVPIRRNRDARGEEMISAPRQRFELELLARDVTNRFEDFDRFGRDFLPDAVTRYDRDSHRRSNRR